MLTVAERQAGEIVAGWRTDEPVAGWESPAGPLFTGDEYAEHELTMTGGSGCGTACTQQSCIRNTRVIVHCC